MVVIHIKWVESTNQPGASKYWHLHSNICTLANDDPRVMITWAFTADHSKSIFANYRVLFNSFRGSFAKQNVYGELDSVVH